MTPRKDSTEEILKLGDDLYEDYLLKYPPSVPDFYEAADTIYGRMDGFSRYRLALADELLKRGWTLANYDWANDDDSKAYCDELMARPIEPLSPCTIIHMDGIEDEPEDEL